MNLSNWLGMPIFESENCLKETDEPLKKHKKRRNQTSAYHNRISKKWLKKFGTKKVPCMWRTPRGLLIHPSLMDELRRQLQIKNTIVASSASPFFNFQPIN